MLTNGWLKVPYEGRYWDELSSFADEWVTSNPIQDYVTDYTANRPDKSIDDFEKHYIARLLPHDRKIVTYKASDSFLSFALQPTIVNFITKCMDGHQPTLQYYDLTKSRTYGVWVYNDSERILAKPRYNLTDEAREKFASPVLFEHRDWLIKKEKGMQNAS